jgi:RsiW-degrading membrane proteinase PrsW (M82 family)
VSYLLFFIFGLAPSVIWLLYFLRKDVHPEPKRMVLRIFLWGMLITLPAIFIEKGVFEVIKTLNLPYFFYIFLGIAGTEELLKYLVVKEKVLNNPEFDEPLDAMLYMVISALGFAGLENILILFSSPFNFFEMFFISILRFIGAVFLHTLCSGSFGYFLSLSFFEAKNRTKLFLAGILIAILAHGFFNLSITKIEESLKIEENQIMIVDQKTFAFFTFFLIIILIGLAIFVSFGFNKLKKMKSVCLIKNREVNK